jgi:hypothetical protein
MAKMIEVKLHRLTCEFAEVDGETLVVAGNFTVFTFDNPAVISETKVIFDFPDGPIRLRKGENVTINRNARVTVSTPTHDPPGFGAFNMTFGGSLDALGSEVQTLNSNQLIFPDPQMWRLYFGRNERIVRADLSVHFVHPL